MLTFTSAALDVVSPRSHGHALHTHRKPRAGLEPATPSFEARCSNPLSYRGFCLYLCGGECVFEWRLGAWVRRVVGPRAVTRVLDAALCGAAFARKLSAARVVLKSWLVLVSWRSR